MSRNLSSRGALRAVLLGVVAATTCPLASCHADDDGLGYTDTPLLPNSQWRVHDRARPQPPVVAPGESTASPPADAVVLFDGRDLSQWESDNADGPKPRDLNVGIEQGCFNIAKTGQIRTKRQFGDCQLHVEWSTPSPRDGNVFNWGNSGVFFLGKYELQIIESHDSRVYADGIAGAVYGQTPPLVNAARKPGQWQSYDIVFTAPRFDGQKLLAPACFTVFWNGILVQDHTASLGPTRHKEVATYTSHETTGPILLQYHGSAVRFRNIWLQPLKPGEAASSARPGHLAKALSTSRTMRKP